MREIYLDNSATTRVCEKSAEKVLDERTDLLQRSVHSSEPVQIAGAAVHYV